MAQKKHESNNSILNAFFLFASGVTVLVLVIVIALLFEKTQSFKQTENTNLEGRVLYLSRELNYMLAEEMITAMYRLRFEGGDHPDFTSHGDDRKKWNDLVQRNNENFQDIIGEVQPFLVSEASKSVHEKLQTQYIALQTLQQKITVGSYIHAHTLIDEYDHILQEIDNLRNEILGPRNPEQFVLQQHLLFGKSIHKLFDSIAKEGALLIRMLSEGKDVNEKLTLKLADVRAESVHQRSVLELYLNRVLSDKRSNYFKDNVDEVQNALKTIDANLEQFGLVRQHVQSGGNLTNNFSLSAESIQKQVNTVLHSISDLETLVMQPSLLAMDRQVRNISMQLVLISVFCLTILAILIALLFFLKKRVLDPITLVTERMSALAQGVLNVELPETDRDDEIGQMIRALEIFKKRAKAEQSRQKMDSLGNLAGGLAHEVNNALQPIMGLSDLLVKRPEDSRDHVQEIEKIILDSSKYARDIINDMLSFSRQEVTEKEVVNVASAIQDVTEFVKGMMPPGIEVKGEGIGFTAEDGELEAPLNITGLKQIIHNLFNNAADAMDEKGVIQICVANKKVDDRNVLGLSSGAYLVVSIADEGCGMDEATKNSIFDPFFTTKEIGTGTGLGLAVVYGILQDWGGAISVESALGKGTTFYIYIPLDAKG